jgi:hypothetical protein
VQPRGHVCCCAHGLLLAHGVDRIEKAASFVEACLQARPVVPEDLVPLRLVSTGDDAAYVGDRHVDRPEQRDHPGRASLTPRVEAVAGRCSPGGLEEPETVVPPQLRDAEADQLGELPDLEPITTLTHEPSLEASLA